MHGTMLILRPGDPPEVVRYRAKPTLSELQTAVGGYIERVPQFDTMPWAGTVMNCVVYCNENGKLEKLPINREATMAWERSLRRHGNTLNDGNNNATDVLVGSVAVLFGDKAFMASL